MKWVGITGTWRTADPQVEKDVRNAIRAIMERGDGIVIGGTFGVDFFAADEAFKANPEANRIKIAVPSSYENYLAHLILWADGHETGDEPITREDVNVLQRQLDSIRAANPKAIIECGTYLPENIDGVAYYARNSVVADLSDELLAFHINKSRGTQDTIDKARAQGKKVTVTEYVRSRG